MECRTWPPRCGSSRSTPNLAMPMLRSTACCGSGRKARTPGRSGTRSTTGCDRGHDASLGSRERRTMLLTIGFAVTAEDVRDFQLRAIHRAQRLEGLGWCGLDLHRNRARQQVQRVRCGADFAGCNAEIFCCRGQAAMAEQQLNGTDVGARFKQVNGESVTQRMRCDGFGDFANAVGLLARLLNCVS